MTFFLCCAQRNKPMRKRTVRFSICWLVKSRKTWVRPIRGIGWTVHTRGQADVVFFFTVQRNFVINHDEVLQANDVQL